jgi:proline iminopeptidase
MDEQVRASDGLRLWATSTGDGTPLVLCHGGPGMWDYFDDVADMLRGTARVVRWDQRGCGRSQRCGPYSIARSVADLDAVRDQLAGRRTAVLGHSWGAHLALRYALEHRQRVSHLIYVAGTGIDGDRGWHPHYERNLRLRLGNRLERWETLDTRARTPIEEREWAVLQWSADFADPGTALQHAERMATPWLGINYDCSKAINTEAKQELANGNLAALCQALDIPVLIIDGDADIRPRWAVESLHEALPNAERVNLAGAGHLPWVERPDEFSRTVTTFLTNNSDATRRHPDAGFA